MAPEAAWRRLHPSTLLFDVGRRFASLAFWGLAALFFAVRTEELWYFLFLLPPVLEALLRFVSFRYALSGDHLVIREGVLTRSVRHVPCARVQNIDTVQGPLHRLLGVVEVRLETAGGSEPEALFRVISLAQLAELRGRVFGTRASGPPVDAAAAFAPRDEAFFRMPTADVLLFGLLSQKGLLYLFGAFFAVREFTSREKVEELAGPLLESLFAGLRFLGPWPWLVLGGLFFLALQLASMLWALFTLYDFRIERHGEDLRTTCGLFTRQSASLPRGRVQGLEARASPVQRWLGRVSVRALSAGGDSTEDSQVTRKWLVPSCPADELADLLREVQPEASFHSVEWRAVHPRAVRRLLVRWLALLEPVGALGWLHSPALGLAGAVLGGLFAWTCARGSARRLGWGVGERALFLRDGFFWRRLACVRFEKIQSITCSRSPFDRRAGMASVSVDTAGPSSSGLSFVIPFLGVRQAIGLMRKLQGEAAAASFRW